MGIGFHIFLKIKQYFENIVIFDPIDLSRESGKEKTKVRPDCSAAPTQLALCLRFAYFRLKRRELTTRRNPR